MDHFYDLKFKYGSFYTDIVHLRIYLRTFDNTAADMDVTNAYIVILICMLFQMNNLYDVFFWNMSYSTVIFFVVLLCFMLCVL